MAEKLKFGLHLEDIKGLWGTTTDPRSKASIIKLLTSEVPQIDEDFWGPTIDSTHWTVGNGGGASAASPAADVGLVNGQCKLVTGTVGDNTASSIITSGRHFRGDQNAVMEVRLNINTAVTAVKVEVGFRDSILTTAGNGNLVNVMATPTFNTNYTADGACWCYDTNNSGVGWEGLSVAAGAAGTTDTGYNVAPVLDTFETLQVALLDGVAYFSRFTVDGKRMYGPKAVAVAVTKTTLQAAYVYVEARSVTSKTVDIDYIKVWQQRTSTP